MKVLSRFAAALLLLISGVVSAHAQFPTPTPPVYDEVQRLALAANPLGCEDHPHSSGMIRPGYLWQRDGKPQIIDDYEKHRAFYGCLDWHSGVNSTWMMISLIKADPTIAVAPAMRNELAARRTPVDPEGIHAARIALVRAIASVVRYGLRGE